MVEVRNLEPNVEIPKGDNWVVVEQSNGAYFLAGRANGRLVEAHVSPSGFADPGAAMRAATWWAEYLEAPVIYLKTAPARRERTKRPDVTSGGESPGARTPRALVSTRSTRELEPV